MVKKQTSFNYEIKFPKKLLLVFVVLILLLGAIYFSKRFFIAASVNGKSISRLTVIKELEKQGGKNVLETIITETIIRQEAEKRKIGVSQKEIDEEMKKIESNVVSQGSTLDQALQNQGMTKTVLIEQIKIQLMLQKMAGANITVSEKEIEDFISASKNQQGFEQEITKVTRVIAEKYRPQKIILFGAH